jgi:hypothetical protein
MDSLFDAVAVQASRINNGDDAEDVMAVIQALAIRGVALAGTAMAALGEPGVLSAAEVKTLESTIGGREL